MCQPVGEGDCVWASNDIKTGVLNESQPLDHADDGCSNSLEWVSSSSCSSIGIADNSICVCILFYFLNF